MVLVDIRKKEAHKVLNTATSPFILSLLKSLGYDSFGTADRYATVKFIVYKLDRAARRDGLPESR